MKNTLYTSFLSRKVEANSLADFLTRYYKIDRLSKRGKDYVKAVTQSHQKDLNKFGYTIVSQHESVTGEVVAFYEKTQPKESIKRVLYSSNR